MTTIHVYCMAPDHATREGADGWTAEPTLILTFDGEPPADPTSGYLSLCGACARAEVPSGD